MGRKCMRFPTPDDAATIIPTMLISEAAAHYGVSKTVVSRWAAELDVHPRPRTIEDARRYGRLWQTVVIDVNAPGPRKTCSRCQQSYPIAAYEHMLFGTALRAQCRLCRAEARRESRERTRQNPPPIKATVPEIDISLYRTALRALTTAPPVPVWEREEWA